MGIVLTMVVGITQLILGGLGVYVSLRPPDKKYHRYWIAVFLIIGIGGVGLTGWLAKTGSDAQNKASNDIHDAVLAATNANTAATNANNSATLAQRETAEARAEARKANNDLEKLINLRSSETTSHITQWRSDTETAVGKILRPPRTLTIDQRKTIVRILKTFGEFEIGLRHTEGNAESQDYADQLAAALAEAGWKQRRPKFLVHQREVYGMWVLIGDDKQVPPAANKLHEALQAAGIETKGMVVDGLGPSTVDLMVGLQ